MGYNKVTPEILDKLKEIAPSRVFFGENINDDYCHDEMPAYGKKFPEAVVEATCVDEISKVLRLCNDNLIPLTARGSGTGLAGGAVPIQGGIVLSTKRMNKILEYDLENFTVRVQPGVLLNDLSEDAAKYGLFYPPDPGEKLATLGGNVSTNAGGMRAVKYGVTRDYVKSAKVVLPTGEILDFGRNVAKSSSGYSLLSLIIGSEGTLGVIAELTLKLLPEPKETVSLIVPFKDLYTGIKTVPKLLMSGFNPQALEFMGRDIVEATEAYLEKKTFPKVIGGVTAQAYLLITFDGNSEDVLNDTIERASEIMLDEGAIDVLVADTPELKRNAWNARSSFYKAILSITPEIEECDVVVPINRIAEYFSYLNELSEKHNVRIMGFGHAGDGNLHIYPFKDKLSDEEWSIKSKNVMDDLYDKAKEMGGLVSGEHGIGRVKMEYLEETLGETSINLMFGIKKVFDPNLILNPGKVCHKL